MNNIGLSSRSNGTAGSSRARDASFFERIVLMGGKGCVLTHIKEGYTFALGAFDRTRLSLSVRGPDQGDMPSKAIILQSGLDSNKNY